MKRVILVLIALAIAGCDLRNERVELVEFGTFKKVTSGDDRTAPETVAGKVHTVSKAILLEQTTDIPARLGTSFGLRLKFMRKNPDEVVRCTAKCFHPRLTDPAWNTTREVDEWAMFGATGSDNFVGYTFDHDWELVPG